jgi:hypothetical protein
VRRRLQIDLELFSVPMNKEKPGRMFPVSVPDHTLRGRCSGTTELLYQSLREIASWRRITVGFI